MARPDFNLRRRKTPLPARRLSKSQLSLQRLEDRLALHGDEHETTVGEPWLDHLLDDTAAFDATAGNEPVPDLIKADVAAAPTDAGQWSPVQAWQIEFINALMLPTGKVLGYDRTLNLRLWDPTDGTFSTPASPGYNFFCSGMSLLADGDVLMTGGAIVDTVGLPYAALYNPFTDTWTQLGNMNAGRWYPSTTTLANGDALVLSGDTNGNVTDPLPQIYDAETGTWRDLTGAVQTLPFYPRTFSAPNGDAFIAGPQQFTEYLDTSGVGAIIPVGNRVYPDRNFGSAVMYAPGKILYVGGGGPATASAEVIDLNQPNPTWRSVAPMAFSRRNCNATLLPSGEVLIIGGNTGAGNYDGDAVMAAEIWDPKTETFRTVADMSDVRWYHSTALLLPDGRVLSTSGDLHLTGQVYSPPYLFAGTRPTIASAPGTVGYGDTFFVGTPDAANITNVRWIRLGTATHAQDWDQYMSDAAFTKTAGGLNVSAPPVPDSSPPGYYFLTILKGGVPSVSKIVRVGALPTVSIKGTTVTEGATGATTNAQFTVTLSESSAKTVTVNYATADGEALAGQDYTAKTGTLTFAPGETTKTITVAIKGDGVVDLNEMFTVNLTAPTQATLGIATGQGLIRDNSLLPVLQIKGTTLIEKDAGTQNAAFVVTLSSARTTPVTVAYTTVNGTASAGSDFTTTTGTLTFAPGVTTQTINVPVKGDTTDEFNETFSVKLSNPTGATIEVAQADTLIYNNDAPVVANLVGTATFDEPAAGATANATITVTLSAPSGKPVTVHWTTAEDGTAKIGRNYLDQVGDITFAPGETTKTFTVTVKGDGVKRPNGTFSIQMQSELENANFGNRYTLVSIVDKDALPSISLSNASITEGNSGTKNLTFTATLSAAVNQAVTVNYATSAGTATANTDYTETTGTITFAAGTTTKTFNVVIKGDGTAESNETFNIVLSNPSAATIDAGKAIGTIVDDDGAGVPAAPANFVAVAGFGLAALSWNAVPGATSYRLYRGTNVNGEGTSPIATGIAGTTYSDTGLVNGKSYYYFVTAIKGAFEGSASNEIAVVPTSYDFTKGFTGRSLDRTVSNADGSNAVLSPNGLNIANARLSGQTVQLTDGGTNQTDSIFTRNPVDITRFTTQFKFQQLASFLYTDPLADGMTFTIQGVAPDVLGVSGGGLGYAGIAKSVAIKFDLYDSDGEGPNSTGLYTNGALPTSLNSINLNGTGIDLHSEHPFSVSMTYDGTTLKVTISDTVTLATATQSYAVNIPAIIGGNTAFVGFTAGTGGLSAVQKIHSWILTPAPTTPANLQVSDNSAAQIALKWTNSDPNAERVLIERRTGANGAYAQIGTTLTAIGNTYVDTTVTAGTTYSYRVRSINKDSTSVYSNVVNAQAGVAAASIASFTLINADTDLPIAGYDPIPALATLNLATLPTKNLNVRANTTGTFSSVKFGLDSNASYRIENAAPWALASDGDGDFHAWTPAVGMHVLTATPYAGADATGAAGTSRTITFNVIDQASKPTVTIVATDPSAAEPSATGKFTVTRTGSTTSALVVKYAIDGTATNMVDYNLLLGAVTIPAGATTATILVTPKDDTKVEGTETVKLTLNVDNAYTVGGQNNATVSIADDEQVSQAVVSFTLINADTNLPIAGYNPIPALATLNLATLPTKNLNIRANTTGTIASVKFGLDGNASYHIEGAAPWALAADTDGDYKAWTPTVGMHLVTATPYSGENATGTAGKPLSILFNVVNQGAAAAAAAAPLDTTRSTAASESLLSADALNDASWAAAVDQTLLTNQDLVFDEVIPTLIARAKLLAGRPSK